jgi:RNA polymerase sigma-70 factor (ECF subfamily)
MNDFPDTRTTLLLRLRDAGDQQAWNEFAAIYEPLVYRLARGAGLQHADALDLCQEVLLAVAGAIDRWTPDPELGKFRSWLYRVARNLTINALARPSRRPLGAGGTTMVNILASQPDLNVAGSDAEQFDSEFRRAAFAWAAQQVRRECQPQTWQAFWLTAVEGSDVESVAARLRLSIGSVYAARSRIMARLRRKVEQFQPGDAAAEG